MKKLPITFKVGTRSSKLATIQTEEALKQISNKISEINFKTYSYSTFGDKDKKIDLRNSPDNIFTKELDGAILSEEIDFAVHSAKDVPYHLPADIDWFWLPHHEDARDSIILRPGKRLEDLPKNPVIGISSDRRSAYCTNRFPNAIQKKIRGNLEERIQLLDDGVFDIIIMAAAGLHRLDLSSRIHQYISVDELSTPDGQGHLAITFRKKDKRLLAIRSLFISSITFAGAGVGRKDLCTLETLRALKRCDVCLYDSLMDHQLLHELPEQSQTIDVGKRCGAHSKDQAGITDLICRYTLQGLRVVRLKGGDPGIFGRLAEEIEGAENAHIAYRVIPGITALQSASTETGMLLTRRDVSRGFTVITPRASGNKLASCNQETRSSLPIIYYMATKAMKEIATELLNEGFTATTPVSIIYGAGTNHERIIKTYLEELSILNNPKECRPGLIIVGNITFYQYNRNVGALQGMRILLTCSDALQQKAKNLVNDYGGKPISFPLIKLSYNKHFLFDTKKYTWIAISSPSSVRAFMQYIDEYKIDIRRLPKIMVCGQGTANEFTKYNIHVDAQPTKGFSADALLKIASSILTKKDVVLRLRSEKAGENLGLALRKIAAKVDDKIIYLNQMVTHDMLPDFDIIFFSSSSGVNNFINQWEPKMLDKKIILVIGSSTSNTLEKYNIKNYLISKEATVQSAIDTLAVDIVKKSLSSTIL